MCLRFRVQPSRWPEKRAVKSKMRLQPSDDKRANIEIRHSSQDGEMVEVF